MSELLKLADNLPSRIVSRILPVESGCWEWQGYRNEKGYGQVQGLHGKTISPHRLVCQVVNGLPDDMQVDHLCRNPSCCNPSHLEAVTSRENTRRGLAGEHRRISAKLISACPKGHEYTTVNTYVCSRGKRSCRECHRQRMHICNARRRGKAS